MLMSNINLMCSRTGYTEVQKKTKQKKKKQKKNIFFYFKPD